MWTGACDHRLIPSGEAHGAGWVVHGPVPRGVAHGGGGVDVFPTACTAHALVVSVVLSSGPPQPLLALLRGPLVQGDPGAEGSAGLDRFPFRNRLWTFYRSTGHLA